MNKYKLMRITTVPISLKLLLKGQCRFMSDHFDVIGISSDCAELNEVAENEGIRVIPVNMTRKITPLSDFVSLFKLILICIRERPIIIHTHTPKAGLLGMLAARIINIPIRIHTVAGLPLEVATGFKRKLLFWTEWFTLKCATNVYPNSKGILEFIKNNKITSLDKVKIIGNGSSNGIDTNYFNTHLISDDQKEILFRNLKISFSDFVFIYVGRIVGDKGINELIQAFVQIKNENVKLVLVGNFEEDLDPLSDISIKIIRENNNIHHVGFQNDVRPYFAISKVLVFPSYREGFPNVVMQAGAMEVPSIVTNINGCNEIINNEFNGLIIPKRDVNSLKFAMEKLINDSSLLSSLRYNSRKYIVDNFDQKTLWNNLLEEYNSLLKDRMN